MNDSLLKLGLYLGRMQSKLLVNKSFYFFNGYNNACVMLHQQGEMHECVGHHHSAGPSTGQSAALRPGRRLPHREHLQCNEDRYVDVMFQSSNNRGILANVLLSCCE